MASNIISDSIDAAYPVAGVDNDTQGFRDNFSIIKSNFANAKSEIEALQDNTVKLDVENNFNGNTLIEANLQASTSKFLNKGNFENDVVVNFGDGHYQKFGFVGAAPSTINVTLDDWPFLGNDDPDRVAKLTLEIYGNDQETTTINFVVNDGDLKKNSTNWPSTFTVASSSIATIAEFWTYDGGATVFGRYLGRFE